MEWRIILFWAKLKQGEPQAEDPLLKSVVNGEETSPGINDFLYSDGYGTYSARNSTISRSSFNGAYANAGGNQSQQDEVTQKHLTDFVSKNPLYKKYPAEWILDSKGVKTSENNPSKTMPTIKRNSEGKLYVSGIQVFIHPSAFDTNTDSRQTLITGHEFIHLSHLRSDSFTDWYNKFGQNGARAISEYWAYKWQVENEVRLGYTIDGKAGLDKWTNLLPVKYIPR